MFRYSGHKTYGILAPLPGTEPTPALEVEVLTTEPPGNSWPYFFF